MMTFTKVELEKILSFPEQKYFSDQLEYKLISETSYPKSIFGFENVL